MHTVYFRYVFVLVAFCITAILFHAPTRTHFVPRLNRFPSNFAALTTEPEKDANILRVRNTTLGFQEIKVISLPERSDKRDAWAVATSLSGFDVDIVDGVDGTTIPPKALPYTMEQKPTILGCWRAHMNILQDMVNRDVASALILEDDADWDVHFKTELQQFANGSRWILNQTVDSMPQSPYGDHWDLLWLGHCGTRADPWDNRRFVVPNDPTTDLPVLRTYGMGPDTYHWEDANPPDPHIRLVFSQYYGVCTAGYAVSLAGAKKILYHLSMSPFNDPVDMGYSNLCKHKPSNFTCVGSWPPLIGVHRPAGKTAGWSDVEQDFGDVVEQPHSERVMFPTRMNIDRLLVGSGVFRSNGAQNIEPYDLDFSTIEIPVGHEEHIEIGPNDALY